MKQYTWAMDLSLSNTGICIFDGNNPITAFNIQTSNKDTHGNRLKAIADSILEKMKEYPPKFVVIEAGFTRFNKATQVLYRVHGLVNYLLCDYEQVYYPSKTVKKKVCGNGNASKDDVKNFVNRKYPHLVIENDNESDAVAVGMCYFLEGNNEQKCL